MFFAKSLFINRVAVTEFSAGAPAAATQLFYNGEPQIHTLSARWASERASILATALRSFAPYWRSKAWFNNRSKIFFQFLSNFAVLGLFEFVTLRSQNLPQI